MAKASNIPPKKSTAMSSQDKKVQLEEQDSVATAQAAEAPTAAAAEAPTAPAPATAPVVVPMSIPEDAAALQTDFGKSLAEITQSFANNQGYPAADATASINGDIVTNTPNGLKTVRNLVP